MRAVFCMAVSLAGCAMMHRDDDAAGIPHQCVEQADQDPTVQSLKLRGTTNIAAYADAREPLRAARARAAADCMRQMGLIPPGGVEKRNP